MERIDGGGIGRGRENGERKGERVGREGISETMLDLVNCRFF